MLGHLPIDVIQVEPAVVIVIAEGGAPGEVVRQGQAGRFGHIHQHQIALVAIEAVRRGGAGQQQIAIAVVVVVGPQRHFHLAGIVDQGRQLLESTDAVVAIEQHRQALAGGDGEVVVAVAVEIGKADPATIGEDANGVLQPQGRRDIDKIGGLRDAPKGQGAEEKRGVGFHGGLFCYNG